MTLLLRFTTQIRRKKGRSGHHELLTKIAFQINKKKIFKIKCQNILPILHSESFFLEVFTFATSMKIIIVIIASLFEFGLNINVYKICAKLRLSFYNNKPVLFTLNGHQCLHNMQAQFFDCHFFYFCSENLIRSCFS